MKALLLVAAAAAALSFTACQKKPAETTAAPEAAAPAAATAESATEAAAPAGAMFAADPIEPAPDAAPSSTEVLIKGVVLVDIYQAQAARIAEAKAQSAGVKDFAKQMATDHAALTSQLKHLAAATKVTLPTELGARGKGMIAALDSAAPADFDRLYLDQQQAAHAAEIVLLREYALGGESTDIKPAADKAVPKVQAHLDEVQKLQAALK